MTSKTLKKKVIEYINHAEDNVIEAVYKMLKIYQDSEGKSLMTSRQKSEIEKHSTLFRQRCSKKEIVNLLYRTTF